MGVYISGIEMPKSEEILCVNIHPDGKVCINLDLKCTQIATAVPVPDHGDLIDRDAARGSIKSCSPEDEKNCCTFDTVKKLMHIMLDRASTVIPAEEGEG